MPEPVTNPDYWKERLRSALLRGKLHEAVFLENETRWKAIEEKHSRILCRHIGREDSILDAGCGYGRMLDLLPSYWQGLYQGIDVCKEFIDLAKAKYSVDYDFAVGSLHDMSKFADRAFDWAILISVRPMLIRNMGEEYWLKCERELKRVAKKLLYLEYDPNDNGSVEE